MYLIISYLLACPWTSGSCWPPSLTALLPAAQAAWASASWLRESELDVAEVAFFP